MVGRIDTDNSSGLLHRHRQFFRPFASTPTISRRPFRVVAGQTVATVFGTRTIVGLDSKRQGNCRSRFKTPVKLSVSMRFGLEIVGVDAFGRDDCRSRRVSAEELPVSMDVSRELSVWTRSALGPWPGPGRG
ncbi:MAG: hypothetical protein LBD70_02655, partial [Bifidobacteriaceae bacterium]|nr:hypothetical protein [Bifidobacteriaceae bacterium]